MDVQCKNVYVCASVCLLDGNIDEWEEERQRERWREEVSDGKRGSQEEAACCCFRYQPLRLAEPFGEQLGGPHVDEVGAALGRDDGRQERLAWVVVAAVVVAFTLVEVWRSPRRKKKRNEKRPGDVVCVGLISSLFFVGVCYRSPTARGGGRR